MQCTKPTCGCFNAPFYISVFSRSVSVTAAEVVWGDLPAPQRVELARAWEHPRASRVQSSTVSNPTSCVGSGITTLHRRNGDAAAELDRIAANVDPKTVAAFDELINEGAAILAEVERFLRRFIAYPSESAVVAHVLWIAHTHRMEIWDSTPRIAFLSPEPGSGKSRALEATELVVPRPVHA